ncbi:MAG: thiamine-phosphate pyrophosphorylase [Candidatus Omnitrophica bacterium]|nr:thiamine-phosphate pyrophosphorylase [Candidatus Omnitrophota bacterium]
MLKKFEMKLLRVVDANFNRAKEGLRVCEDVCRFWLNEKSSTKKFKDIRHQLTAHVGCFGYQDLIIGRDIQTDQGRATILSESKRETIADVFYANCQRAKESLRVLEEFAKFKDARAAAEIKNLRYNVYAVEQKVLTSSGLHVK